MNFMNYMNYVIIILPLVFTIIIEGITIWILTKRKKWLHYNVLCNTFTTLLLNYVEVYLVSSEYYINTVICGTLISIILEAILYIVLIHEDKKKCFIYSLISNLVSTALGIIILNIVYALSSTYISELY